MVTFWGGRYDLPGTQWPQYLLIFTLKRCQRFAPSHFIHHPTPRWFSSSSCSSSWSVFTSPPVILVLVSLRMIRTIMTVGRKLCQNDNDAVTKHGMLWFTVIQDFAQESWWLEASRLHLDLNPLSFGRQPILRGEAACSVTIQGRWGKRPNNFHLFHLGSACSARSPCSPC